MPKHYRATIVVNKTHWAGWNSSMKFLLTYRKSSIMVECLVPDFGGNTESVKLIAKCGLDVYAHNIETVEALTPYVRDKRAKYR